MKLTNQIRNNNRNCREKASGHPNQEIACKRVYKFGVL